MNRVLIAPPAGEPVALAEARAWLRVDSSDEDQAIAALIVAARETVEAATRRALVAQTWRLTLDDWPFAPGARAEMALPLAPLASVTAARVYDAGGQPQLLPSSLWRVVGAPDRARLIFTAQPPRPGVSASGVEIDCVAGYGAAADVPAPLRQAILMLAADWFENRGDGDDAPATPLPKRVAALLAPYRRGRLA
jgi:uncharacterized phiE125 gp8 family phage protein